MLFCAPVSHTQAGSHEHHAQAAEAHHAQPGDAQQSSDKAHGKCSACASCCSAAALTTEQPELAAPPLDQALSSSPLRGLERVMTGGIERPPRLARL
ncbi:hypothetical protein [Roseateles oligotrophus]|nr:hypothetical protein [Roseateles oligotrophus]